MYLFPLLTLIEDVLYAPVYTCVIVVLNMTIILNMNLRPDRYQIRSIHITLKLP